MQSVLIVLYAAPARGGRRILSGPFQARDGFDDCADRGEGEMLPDRGVGLAPCQRGHFGLDRYVVAAHELDVFVARYFMFLQHLVHSCQPIHLRNVHTGEYYTPM